ncbi:hypothetical protein [Aquisalibacillus elongatus]|uniref:Uncharacterized protein n=1 Tax=Aquisalibacillus elongatus TaxID=485577 RepID=A0A3N5C9M5_9BACI|nr:hypothetical protein [Aquisalibacillus elongatus]RPF53361.1 hypothetical protein EDC24_1860 [Aquisalibacillus elongatus]
MTFVIYFAISWLAVTTYCVMNKKLSLIESTMIYLVVLVISINFSWIIVEEMELVSIKEKANSYMAYIFKRSVITPFVMIIFLDLILRFEKVLAKIMTGIGAILFLTFCRYLLVQLEAATYLDWNFGYDMLFFLALTFITIMTYNVFHKITKSAVNLQ